jgi:hypothetical protein
MTILPPPSQFMRVLSLFCLALAAHAADFNREIRPILASKCYACHGPDAESREAKLRLDVRDDALKNDVIVPGKVKESEFHYRIRTDDPDEIMPPPKSKMTLTEAEKDLLEEWIAEGAAYERHWAFVPPSGDDVPATVTWGHNSIDAFVLKRLQAEGLEPAAEADRYTLVRRLYLDLIGLPPTPPQADAFVADARPDAYERLVDALLASPHYGEKWGRHWLDLARYADSNGYEKDRPRNIWPYRDWVIRALNADMPYDQFSIEQLAGDMLPNATQDQKVATGFHRNTQLNEEGGIDPLEFRYYAAVDRVATTGTVWLGMTTGCAQCHTHKYDPITHDEYFGMMALLDNVEEPDLLLETPEQAAQKQTIAAQIEAKTLALQKESPGFDAAFEAWRKQAQDAATNWTTLRPSKMKTNLPKLEVLDDGSIYSSGDVTKRDVFTLTFASDEPVSALRLEVLPDDRLPNRGPGRCYYEGRKGDFFLSEFSVTSNGAKHAIVDPSHSYGKISIGGGSAAAKNVTDGDGSSGWSTAGQTGKPNHLVLPLAQPIPPNTPFTIEMLFERHFVVSLGRFRLAATTDSRRPKAQPLGVEVEAILAKQNATADELARLKASFLEQEFLGKATMGFAKQANWIWDAKGERPTQTLHFTKELELPAAPKAASLLFTGDDSIEFFVNGKSVGASNHWRKPIEVKIQLKKGKNLLSAQVTNQGGPGGFIAQLAYTPKAGKPAELWTDDSWRYGKDKTPVVVGSYGDLPWGDFKPARDTKALAQLRAKLPRPNHSPIMQERPSDNPRPTYLRHRGEYISPKHEVSPGIPAVFLGDGQKSPRNRLEFARWLAGPDNPLGDRVTVNRAWRAFFGAGLVRTSGDFGTQAPAPDHPELLDWLAVTFRKLGMSQKQLHRLIVTSATYRQRADASPDLLRHDPENRLLGRGPRFRLSGELIRDHMLAASGKLSTKMYGPGVYPPQPASVLAHAFGNQNWAVSKGDDRYRRSIYTFIKRTAPFAGYMTFDGSSGENCLARRNRSNTPLQALTLLNDEMFLELARAAGKDVHTQDDVIGLLFRRFLTRPPTEAERHTLQAYLDQQLARLRDGKLKPGEIAADKQATPEWAGSVLLARAIMNLDEAITKP